MKRYAWLLLCAEFSDCVADECEDPDIREHIYGNEDAVIVTVVGKHEKFEDNLVTIISDNEEHQLFIATDGSLYNFSEHYSKEEILKEFDTAFAESDPKV